VYTFYSCMFDNQVPNEKLFLKRYFVLSRSCDFIVYEEEKNPI